jgi:hypothetical protein
MADKNTRVGKERIGRPADEQVTGRAEGAGDYQGSLGSTRPATTPPAATVRRTAPSHTDRDREPNADLRARELREEIEATREDMSETVNAIQDRLRPGTIAANAADSIRDAAADRTRDIVESEPVQYVRANPVPAAMVGIGLAGLAWLAFGGRDADDYRRGRYGRSRARLGAGYYDETTYGGQGARRYDREAYGAYGAEYGREGEGLTERAGEMADDVRQRAQMATRQARRQVNRAQTTLQRTWNDNPLIIGAASAVLGALVGMAVPETEAENEWMGERRDQMVEGVQEAVREKVEDVQNVVRDKVESAQQAANETARQVKEAVGIKDEG